MLSKGAFPLFFLVLAGTSAHAGGCKLWLSELSVGDVVHLSREQAVALGSPETRYYVVEFQDEKKGPALRPVNLKSLKQATDQQPVHQTSPARHFKKNNGEDDLEKVGTATLGRRSFPRSQVSPYDTPISMIEPGHLVRTANNEYWVILHSKTILGARSGAGSEFTPDEKRLQIERYRMEDGKLLSDLKTISVGGWEFESDVRVKALSPVSKSYKIKAHEKSNVQKTVRSRFTEGDMFRYRGKNYIVRNAHEGKYNNEGRSTATWEIEAILLSDKDVATLKSKDEVNAALGESALFNQEGGEYGYLGDFVGPVEFLGNFELGLLLDSNKISKLIEGEKREDENPTVEVPVVYDFVPEP